MIRVAEQPEPQNFDSRVRQPGQKFLRKTSVPTRREWDNHAYWQRIERELHTVHDGICAYSGYYIHLVTGARHVEHFKPKSRFPSQAYEWKNYRLVCGLLNSRKGTREVLDPFTIEDGWFRIHFPSLLVYPASDLSASLKQSIEQTIAILRLNEDEICVPARRRHIDSYCLGRVNFEHLQEEAPFLARELVRQEMVESIKDIWLSPVTSNSAPRLLSRSLPEHDANSNFGIT